jgi:hypothetical protein
MKINKDIVRVKKKLQKIKNKENYFFKFLIFKLIQY